MNKAQGEKHSLKNNPNKDINNTNSFQIWANAQDGILFKDSHDGCSRF